MLQTICCGEQQKPQLDSSIKLLGKSLKNIQGNGEMLEIIMKKFTIILDSRNATGRLATTPRWKVCVGSAASSFAAPVGRLYVSSYFKQEAKVAMLEMVADIRDEFKNILDEVGKITFTCQSN